MIRSNITIINPSNLDNAYIESEIAELEHAHNRKVKTIEFIDLGNGTCKQIIEWVPVPINRIRRITGYLVGDLNRFNDAKLSEVKDRLNHDA